MTWECAECHKVEGREVRVNGVCHHCGRLLCVDDQRLIADPAFAEGAEAVHCRDCKGRYHPFDIELKGRSG